MHGTLLGHQTSLGEPAAHAAALAQLGAGPIIRWSGCAGKARRLTKRQECGIAVGSRATARPASWGAGDGNGTTPASAWRTVVWSAAPRLRRPAPGAATFRTTIHNG